jgi:sugar O-acyltransferase (sialic acid O-acetyltransferase NeuD family)
VVADMARQIGKWDRVSFLDALYPELKKVGDWSVIGKDEDALGVRDDYPELIVAIGDARLRVELIRSFQAQGFSVPVLIHPQASVSEGAMPGLGSVVFSQAAINYGARLGVGCIVNTSASIDHDCQLGAGVHICPGAHLAGEVEVGEYSWIGIGASVVQQIKIGANTVVGAGAAVVVDIPAGVKAAGVPARMIGGKSSE